MISRSRLRFGWIIAAACLAAAPARAQHDQRDDEADTRARPEQKSDPIFTFRITPEMLSNGLDLLVEKRLAKDYGLDEYQQEQMRQVLHERVPRFLREHRAEMEQLWTEWTEVVSADEPPDPAYAAQWAERLMPIVQEARGLVDHVSEDMREFLDDEQEVLLDGYIAAIDLGTRNVTGRLQVFKEGGFDPEIHWPGYAAVRHADPVRVRKLRQNMEKARVTAMSGAAATPHRRSTEAPAPAADPGAADPGATDARLAADAKVRSVAQAKDEWTRYVEAFIRRYQLNEEQKQKAHSFLKQQSEQRDHYLAGKVRKMERVERMFKNAKNDEQRKLAESAYQKLRQPVEGMFERLKEKLETLPTRAQRRAAALAEQKQPAPRKPAPAGKTDKDQP